ncbi:hypothetical protein EON63_09390 [archaeon]|nr:MAG: hypothetical protein EON63_09390 [archaeon]
MGSLTVGQVGGDDNKTLAQMNFVPGDMIDIAITPPVAQVDTI